MVFKEISERATVIIGLDDIRATWERLHDTRWLLWMEIELKKAVATVH